MCSYSRSYTSNKAHYLLEVRSKPSKQGTVKKRADFKELPTEKQSNMMILYYYSVLYRYFAASLSLETQKYKLFGSALYND